MVIIASAPGGRSLTGIELAEHAHVPVHYVSKVLRKLVEAGLLHSQKGHRGGFTLARPAHRIRFTEILAAVDQSPNKNHCAFGWGVCSRKEPCPLHPAWKRLNESFTTWAATTTLAEVATAEFPDE
jgi:Rrf2 family protein